MAFARAIKRPATAATAAHLADRSTTGAMSGASRDWACSDGAALVDAEPEPELELEAAALASKEEIRCLPTSNDSERMSS